MLNGLDLFSGIGGISIALDEWVRPVAYCEKDRFAQSILLSRMSEGKLARAPIWDDVSTLKGTMLPKIDIIFGGFPCQDISCAGNGAGLEGERSGLFFEIVRLIEEIRPTFVFLENVPAIRTRGGETVGKEMAKRRYDCRWETVSAAEVGAPHLRNRWFFLAANTDSLNLWHQSEWNAGRWPRIVQRQGQAKSCDDGAEESLANTQGERRGKAGRLRCDQSTQRLASGGETLVHPNSERRPQGKPGPEVRRWHDDFDSASWWLTEPNVGRVADGVRDRPHRIKALGNSVVPAQAREAFKRLMGL